MYPKTFYLIAAALPVAAFAVIYCQNESPADRNRTGADLSESRFGEPPVSQASLAPTLEPVDDQPFTSSRNPYHVPSGCSIQAGSHSASSRPNGSGIEVAHPGFTSRELNRSRGDFAHPDPPPACPPSRRAIQLAENFQLPAAIMGRSESPEATLTAATPVENFKREMTNDFYRKLADVAFENAINSGSAADQLESILDEESTTVIEPGPETIQIRRQSDELYRTIFGDEAYGRKTMESTLESQLPVLPALPEDI